MPIEMTEPAIATPRKPRKKTKPYPGSITKRGDTWRLRLCVAGEYHSFTVRGTKLQAQNFATEKYAELSGDADRVKVGLPGRVTMSQLIDEFEKFELPTRAPGTQKSYKGSCDTFRRYFVEQLGDLGARDVRRGHCATYLEWRRTANSVEKPASGHTVARDRRVLLRVFNYAIGKDYVDANPVRFAKAPKADPRDPPILSTEQLDALLKAAAPHPMLSLYIVLLADSGVRSYSEALELRWDDVDLAGGSITTHSTTGRRTKSGKTRVVPMTARLHQAMRDHAARFRLALQSPYVFTHAITSRSAKAGEKIKTLRGSFVAAVKAAKLPAGFRAHDLRHRRVTTWLAEGKSPVLVQGAMGHASITTTMGYTHLQAQHLRPLVDDVATAPAVNAPQSTAAG